MEWEFDQLNGITISLPGVKGKLELPCNTEESGVKMLGLLAESALAEAKSKLEADPISTILDSVVSIKQSLSDIATMVKK